MIRKMTLFAVAFLFALPSAHADEASKRAKIEELFTIEKLDAVMQQMATQSLDRNRKLVQNMLAGKQMTTIDKRIVDLYMTRMYEVVNAQLSWEKLKPAYVNLYASTYSEEEVDGILAFYKSSVGQAMLAKNPDLLTKSGAILSARTESLGPQMQQVLADMRKQMHNAHSD